VKHLALFGASGHGKVVAEIAELTGWQVSFFDDAYPEIKQLEHWRVLGNSAGFELQQHEFAGAFVSIGNNVIRLAKIKWLMSMGVELPTLIHPDACVSGYAQIAHSSVVMAMAVVNPFAKLGYGCIVNTAATVDHDCMLAECVHISPGANLAGAVSVGECSWIGIGASVKQCLTIGSQVMVGAGACVVADVANNVTVMGVPAKSMIA
jgi:sugar O-acyltransferase (sialic acid O-acetyltransferase NeuD family)